MSQVVFDAVTAGVEAARATDGIFDPTVLPQLKRIGYSRSFAQMPTELDPARGESRAGGGWQRIMLDPRSRTVVLPSGCALDLGGIAKGMAVDRALELLRARGVDAALVSAGGDLSVLGLPPEERGWSVLVGDDAKREIVPLIRGALATSGIARRSWLQAGVRRHHLLDPRTGEPAANDLHEVTVAAETCEVAEVAATVCFVLGSRLGADFIAALHLAARLIGRNGSHLSAGSWPTPVQDAA